MSRTTTAMLLIGIALVVWFYAVGQAIQSLEVAFVLGIVIGVLVGLWIGGGRVLRKQHHDDVQSAHTKYEKNKEKYL